MRLTIVVLVVAATAFAGCGHADDDRAVRTVTTRFLEAIDDGDGARACAQLSPGAVEALEQDEGSRARGCAGARRCGPGAVTRAQVFATTAKVDLADGHSAFLELTRHGWRIVRRRLRAGGRPTSPTCEVEA